MLNDLAKTVKAQLYERISSPLLGAFIISWFVWNYRFLLVLISSMSADEKFAYIDVKIFNSHQALFYQGALYPLMTTLALIFIYPIPAKFVYEYWRKQQRKLKEIQQRVDDETPLTREEARELRRETLNVQFEFEQELERRSAEITRLKETTKELQNQAKPSIEQSVKKAAKPVSLKTSDTSSPLDAKQVEMLIKIAESPHGVPESELISSSGSDRILAEFNLGELRAKNLVKVEYDSDWREPAAHVTHDGRAYIVKQTRNK